MIARIAASASIALFAPTACVNAPPMATVSQAQSGPLKTYWVRSHIVPGGVLVTGRVRQVGGVQLPYRAHLDITAHFEDGSTMSTGTRWSGIISSRHRSASFRAVIPTTNPQAMRRVELRFDDGH
jgi:hypothetical protein